MSSRDEILAASTQHIQLTRLIAPLASAPDSLVKNQDYIYQLSGKLTSRKGILKSLGIASERLYQDYKSHESSFGKRLMIKTGGERGSRSRKMRESQKKWEEAREKEQEEQENISRLEAQLADAQALDVRLRHQTSEFDRLSLQLDQLNESLFGQTSGEFPTQDAAVSAVKVLEALSVLLQAEMSREKRAREKMAKAIPSLELATKDLQKALNISVDAGVPSNQKYTKQVFKGSGANFTSRGAAPLLLNAKTHSGRCHTLWAEARGSQSLVKAMLPMEIIESYKLPGKGSPKAVDERGLHASLERSYGQARANISLTKAELSNSKSRTQFFTQRQQLLNKQLSESKRSLARVRSSIVEDIVRGGDGKIIRGEFGKGIGFNRDDEKISDSALDADEIKSKALKALREIMKQVQNENGDEFEELPGYHYWPGT